MSKIISVSNGLLSLSVDTFGAEIKSLRKGNKEYIWCGDEKVWEGTAPILFPICGALKDDTMLFGGANYSVPKHGFAKTSDFELTEITQNSITLSLKSNSDTIKYYPFDFIFRVKFELINELLKIYYIVENKSKGNMYFSVGAHEGFALCGGVEGTKVVFGQNDTLYSHFVTGPLLNGMSKMVTEDQDTIVLSDRDFEIDAFIFKNIKSKKISLFDSCGEKKITYIYDDFKNLLLWTKPGAEFLCIEPWSGLPDSIDNDGEFTHKADITELAPFETTVFEHTIIPE